MINKLGLSWAKLSSRLACCQNLIPTSFFSFEVVFLWGRLPVNLFSCKVVFLWGPHPVRSSSCEVVFLWGRLPVRLSSCEVVFLWGCLPLRLSSYKVVFLWGCLRVFWNYRWPNETLAELIWDKKGEWHTLQCTAIIKYQPYAHVLLMFWTWLGKL